MIMSLELQVLVYLSAATVIKIKVVLLGFIWEDITLKIISIKVQQ